MDGPTALWLKTMIRGSPVANSARCRALVLVTALITLAIAAWAQTFGTTHTASRLAPPFVYLFTALDSQGAYYALLIGIVAACVPRPQPLRRCVLWLGQHPWSVALATWVVLCGGALLVYCNDTPSMDEYSPLFQSQVFAAGHITGQFPIDLVDWLVTKEFQAQFLTVSHASGQVASMYWPAFALLLTPFTWLGIPWACNPLISALTLVVIHRLALRIFDDTEAAGLAVLLTLASPVFFADGISYYSMSAHLLANSTYALLLITPTPRKALLAGLVGSVALTLHNPVPHMLFAVPWILALARRQEDGAKLIGALLAGYLPLCVLLGFGWFVFVTGLGQETAGATGAAGAAHIGGSFSFPDSAMLVARAIGIAKIWVWAVPGMVLLAVVGAWRQRANPYCRLLSLSALATLAGFLLIPADQGHGWGFRYFHSAWMCLPLLAAGVFVGTEETTREMRDYLIVCALLTLTAGWALRAVQIHQFTAEDLRETPQYSGTEPRVIINRPGTMGANDPWLRGGVVRLIGHDTASDAKLMQIYFPSYHPVYTDGYGTVWSAKAPQSASPP